MSVAVALAELADRISEFGPVAYLVTTGEDGGPHVVSCTPAWADDGATLAASAGSRTTANAEARPQVTLLWPAAPGGDYALLVDGSAASSPDGLRITPTRAVLHRLPAADAGLPSCVTVL